MSNYSAESFGFFDGSKFFGWAKNLYVSTTQVNIPLIGIGLDTPFALYGISSIPNHVTYRVTSPLPDSLSGYYLNAQIYSLTAGSGEGYTAQTSDGGSYATSSVGSDISVNSGDQFALSFVTTGGSATLPFVSWIIG